MVDDDRPIRDERVREAHRERALELAVTTAGHEQTHQVTARAAEYEKFLNGAPPMVTSEPETTSVMYELSARRRTHAGGHTMLWEGTLSHPTQIWALIEQHTEDGRNEVIIRRAN